MKRKNLLSLFLCLCLTISLLLPMFSACNEGVGEQDTTDQPTSAEHESDTDAVTDPDQQTTNQETDTEPQQGTEQDPEQGSQTEPVTEPVTEPGSESDTQEQPPAPEQSRTLPILRIDTTDGHDVVDKEYYKSCTVTLENCSDPMAFEDVTASIRVRGNSTAVTEKKPFRLKFDKKRNMLGLNDGAKCKSWCLMADYYDYSLMRNSLAFRMCAELLDGYSFASDCTWVELYVNGDYRGVYLLCEQTQINPHRVDIYERRTTRQALRSDI